MSIFVVCYKNFYDLIFFYMKKSILTLSAMILCLPLLAQPGIIKTREAGDGSGKLITMEQAVLGTGIRPQSAYVMWRPNTSELTTVSDDALMLTVSGKEEKAIDLATLNSIAGTDMTGFPAFSWKSENEIIFSFQGRIYAVDIVAKALTDNFTLPEGAANVTPNGKEYYAFTIDNNLYVCDGNGNVIPVTEDTDPNIVNGQTVSRNEFGINGGIFWSEDGKKLAFYRKDESLVGTFPLLDINTRTGSLFEIKYPMAGMNSENVRLGIYDLASNGTVFVQADDFGYDQYLTNITWSPDSRHIFIQVLDRSQKNMRLNMYDATTGAYEKTLLEEHNDRFVEPQWPLYFIEGSDERFIYVTDNRDGYKNLYLCDIDGNIERLTETDADVAYIGQDGKNIYYTSAEISPVENHLFSINLKTRKTARLTHEQGWHSISLSPDGKYFVDSYSSLNTPRIMTVKSSDGKESSVMLEAPDPLEGYAAVEVDLGTVKSADGKYDNYYKLVKPKDFDPSKKYPVIVYVYGGPHSQLIQDTWMGAVGFWELYMAQRGYIVYVQDNRGTMNRGAEFEKAIHRQCGQAEMADQMEGVKMLMSLPYVDKDRIGVHGWSYGGFMTISLITNYPEIFKVAVAGGPVIDWKWYEVMYGERYMDNPAINQEGYAKTSLIAKAKDLEGKLLICQGAIDNTVVWEHSLSFIRECIKNNVQVDYFPYPCAQHNVLGKDRIHLMDKVTMYFEDYL